MSSVTGVRAALHRALDKIGRRNAHACPPGGSNTDPLMHDLFTSHESWSVFDKRRKEAIKSCLEVATVKVVDIEEGTEQVVLEGEHYTLVVKKNNASERVDRVKIGTELRKRGFDEAETLQFMAAITNTTKPATSVRAVPKV